MNRNPDPAAFFDADPVSTAMAFAAAFDACVAQLHALTASPQDWRGRLLSVASTAAGDRQRQGASSADHAGEDLSVPLDLEAGFDDIFHGKDADALSGHGERHVDLGEPFVLGKQLHKLFLIDMKNALFDVRLVSPRQLRNMYLV